jgi:hypothetical protein
MIGHWTEWQRFPGDFITAPFGPGCYARNNMEKRSYVGTHLSQIEYRVIAHASKEEAKKFEHDEFWLKRLSYVFPT